MDQAIQRDPYRVAFEQAKSLFSQLTFELDALDRRHAALLSATKALEVMMAERAGQQAAASPSQSPAVEIARSTASVPLPSRPVIESLTQTYVHRELPNAIQHRIDLALGHH